MDPLADQQLAGLLMWVPMAAVYVAAAMALARRSMAPRGPAHRRYASGTAPPGTP